VCEDLGSSPMCAIWMLFKLCVFVYYILNAWCDDKFLKFVGVIMKSGLVEWFGLGLVCA